MGLLDFLVFLEKSWKKSSGIWVGRTLCMQNLGLTEIHIETILKINTALSKKIRYNPINKATICLVTIDF